MARYHVDNRMVGSQQALAAAFKTSVSVFNASGGVGSRGRIVAISMGLDGAPNATDTQIIFMVERMTADGTGTVATPAPSTPEDVAARVTSKVNYTAEGTYATNQFLRVLNQRASMQWNAQDVDAMIKFASNPAATGLVVVGSGGATPVTAPPGVGVEFEE